MKALQSTTKFSSKLYFSIEIIVICYVLPFSLINVILNKFMEEKVIRTAIFKLINILCVYFQFCRINFNLNISMCESIKNTDYQLSCEHIANTSQQINGTKLKNKIQENYVIYFNESINFDSEFESTSFFNDINNTEFWNLNETIIYNQSNSVYMPNKKVANNSNKKHNISELTSNMCDEKLSITKEINLFVEKSKYLCKYYV